MELILSFFDLIIHLDKHLEIIIKNYGTLTYLILFIIIFCETGLVVTPFLPGDSLLFAAGTLAAITSLEVGWVFMIINIAAFSGDNTNYWIGYGIGPKIFHKDKVRFLNKEYLNKTHQFYEKYGKKTIIIARFVPIVRTFAPFVAGIGRMTYWKFLLFSISAALLWTCVFVIGGYFFGNIPIVKRNFTIVIFIIIIISLTPGIIGLIKHKIDKKRMIQP